MTRTLKLIGLLALAMVALTAAASSAQAVEFHAEEAPVTITGEQEEAHKFTSRAGTISCNKATFHGETEAVTTSTLTISPAYSGCTFLGVVGVPVNMGGCDYVFHASGIVDVAGAECNTKPITFSAAGCTVTIKSQTGLSKVVYTNLGEGTERDVTVTPEVTGITYTQTGILCPNGQGTFSDGTYGPGATTVKGENPLGEQIGVWVE